MKFWVKIYITVELQTVTLHATKQDAQLIVTLRNINSAPSNSKTEVTLLLDKLN